MYIDAYTLLGWLWHAQLFLSKLYCFERNTFELKTLKEYSLIKIFAFKTALYSYYSNILVKDCSLTPSIKLLQSVQPESKGFFWFCFVDSFSLRWAVFVFLTLCFIRNVTVKFENLRLTLINFQHSKWNYSDDVIVTFEFWIVTGFLSCIYLHTHLWTVYF